MDKQRITWKTILREIVLAPTHLYRLMISPWLPPSCIYTPSCSTYMVESVRRHGVFKGVALGTARIARCHHTFFYGGPDPVPEEFSCKSIRTPYTIFRKRRSRKQKHDDEIET
ncbi:MAG TPA: membrane protein insertion efficiency factor YidD [Sphaerochaetaceae bacterium]|nr:membrane protein insertion efficiency factor YidD [Sphaerochaetaceae bacterium]